MTRTSLRLQAQDEKHLSERRLNARKPNRRARQVKDEISPPRDARRMRPYIYGEST